MLVEAVSLTAAKKEDGEAIVDARKDFKKTRSLLRLARHGMPSAPSPDNDRLRDTGRLIVADTARAGR